MLCIDSIADDTRVYKDFTFEEMLQFFENSISNEEFEKINDFYEQIPKLVTKKDYVCDRWGDVLIPKGKGLEDFL
jgi:hypothetical protein